MRIYFPKEKTLLDWDTDWMLKNDDNKEKLMHLNLNVKLPEKLLKSFQELIDGIIRAYNENNMVMYTIIEE